MKSKDQQMLEEAYRKVLSEDDKFQPHDPEMQELAKAGMGEEEHSDEDLGEDSEHTDEEMAERYYSALKKYENDEITREQWTDLCMQILGELMEKNKDVFIRLKNRD